MSGTEIVLRIPTNRPSERLAISVVNDQNNPSASADDDGVVGDFGEDLSVIGPSTLLVSAVATTAGPMAFAIYRAPTDFVRTGVGFTSGVSYPSSPPLFFPPADCTGKQRSVFIRIRSLDVDNVDFKVEIKILRPPVVLVHGLWESPDDWKDFQYAVRCYTLNNPPAGDPCCQNFIFTYRRAVKE